MKNLLLLSLLFFSNVALAQDCSPPMPTYYITFKEDPLKFNMSLYSSQIKGGGEQNIGSHTLGHYLTKVETENNYKFQKTTFSNGRSCTFLTEIHSTITLFSEIKISKEAQAFTCTYNRVLQHERQHYQIQRAGFKKLEGIIGGLYKQQFDNFPVAYNNEINVSNLANQKLQQIAKSLDQYLERTVKPQQLAMDTPQAYNNEELKCSPQENNQLKQLLRNNKR